MAVNENAEIEELIRNASGGGTDAPPLNPAAEAEEEAGGLDIATLVVVARRSLLWVLLLLALGLTASGLYLRYTKQVYKSSSTLKD